MRGWAGRSLALWVEGTHVDPIEHPPNGAVRMLT